MQTRLSYPFATLADTQQYAIERAKRDNLVFVAPYDDPYVIAGQGTIGMEILRQCPGTGGLHAVFGESCHVMRQSTWRHVLHSSSCLPVLHTIVHPLHPSARTLLLAPSSTPVFLINLSTHPTALTPTTPPTPTHPVAIGGGGLAAGVAAYIKSLRPDIKIIGVEPTGSNAMAMSLAQGKRVRLDRVDGFADGVAVKYVGAETMRLCRELLDGVVLVSNSEISAAIKDVFNDTRSILEVRDGIRWGQGGGVMAE